MDYKEIIVLKNVLLWLQYVAQKRQLVAQAKTQYNPTKGLKFYFAVDDGRVGFNVNEKLV